MGLIDELQALEEPQPGPRCTIAVLLEKLTDQEGAALIKAIDEGKATSTAISQALEKAGHRIAAQTITRHRRRSTSKGCRCER